MCLTSWGYQKDESYNCSQKNESLELRAKLSQKRNTLFAIANSDHNCQLLGCRAPFDRTAIELNRERVTVLFWWLPYTGQNGTKMPNNYLQQRNYAFVAKSSPVSLLLRQWIKLCISVLNYQTHSLTTEVTNVHKSKIVLVIDIWFVCSKRT